MRLFITAYTVVALLIVSGCSVKIKPEQTAAEAVSNKTTEAVLQSDAVQSRRDDASLPADGASVESSSSTDDAADEEAANMLDAALELVESARLAWSAGERDRAIDALDQAYAALLRTPADGTDKDLLQQKEDLRFMISKRLTEIYAAKHTAANGTNKEIPLTINEHVEREIQLFQTQEREFFLESYRRSGRYRDQILRAVRDAGLPDDLAWLPLIESGFKVRAMSRARALGLWQFIPSTGYKFGLMRNAWVDERLDPEKSTAAAIAYLKELHQIFGDWATVLAAYNCGEGTVLRAIRGQKIDYFDNFWDLYERLPRETARYYPRFLATLAIIKDPAKYGFELGETEQPMPFEVVRCEKPVQLSKLAEKVGCDPDEIELLNPELRYMATPPGPYELRVPKGKSEAVLASLDSLPKYVPPKPSYVVHRVRRGETLSTIAQRYRTSVSRIVEANNLRAGRMIRAGQKLRIPVTSAS